MSPRRRDPGCERGSTVIEFALLAPVLMLVVMGLCDYAHTLFMISSLQGVVQKAARDSTIENYSTASGQAVLDAAVVSQVKMLNSMATVPPPTRRYYKNYAAASSRTAETWSDTDHDGVCDHGEQYSDANNNSVWDVDGGDSAGGAKDRNVPSVQYSCDLDPSRRWHYVDSGTGTIRLVNVNSGLCLTIAGGVTDRNAVAVQFPCDGDPSRNWHIRL